jgi:uncharacterized protein (TIGR03435 family)
MKQVAQLVLVVAVLASTAAAQTFDTVSVKPSPPPPGNPFGFPVIGIIRMEAGGRVTATTATLRELVRRAYDVQDFLLFGGPEWVDKDRFDIIATPAEGVSRPDAVRAMMRAMLADRFKVVIRTEAREMPIYELHVARPGQLGPTIKPSGVDCAAIRAKRNVGAPLPLDGSEPRCTLSARMSSASSNTTMMLEGESMAEIARLLTPQARRVVVDKTGLPGTYAFELTTARDTSVGRIPGAPPPADDGISLLTGVQDQLGLKLESARGRVEVLVIDTAERPAEN